MGLPDTVQAIKKRAFEGSSIKNFNWPKECGQIPESCFKKSKLERINGIDNVDKVGKQAFCKTKLTSFIWSEKAQTIPVECFYGSPLETIENIDKVRAIESGAFKSSKLTSLDLSKTSIFGVGKDAFLDSAMSKESLIPPYYLSSETLSQAFGE